MVAALLFLVRCQSGQESVLRRVVLLAELVEDVWRPLDAEAREKKLVITNDLHGGESIHTDPYLFRTIVQNLLSNAVEYTPAGGRVRMHASTDNGRFQFQVENTSDVMTQEDLRHLFEPFWRKDDARSNSPHSGLGLAIASECARILGMDIAAELNSQHLLRFILQPDYQLDVPSPGG